MPPVTLKTVEYGKLALGITHGIHERCAHEHRATNPRRQRLETAGKRIGKRRAGKAPLVQSRNRQRDTAAKALAPCKDAVGIHAIKVARNLRQRAAPTDTLDKSRRGNPLLQIAGSNSLIVQRKHGISHGGKPRHVMPSPHGSVDVMEHQTQRNKLGSSGATRGLNQTAVHDIPAELKGNLGVARARIGEINRRNGQPANLKVRSGCLQLGNIRRSIAAPIPEIREP